LSELGVVISQLSAWETFYVIVGAAAGALIGVQFVVITLVAQARRRAPFEAVNAFATPTVVHFSSVLAVAGLLSVPWRSIIAASIALAACGLVGLAHGAVVVHRMRRQSYYRPESGDWVWYSILPGLAYALLVVAALVLSETTPGALLSLGASALGLLLVGIRNAWDTVTHLVASDSVAEGERTGRTASENEEKAP
jgi:hypothetical protein